MTWRTMVSVALVGLLGMSGPAWADDGTKAEIEILRERLDRLEAQQASPPPPEGSAVLNLPSGLSAVNFGGFVDTSYTYSFNEPESGANGLRVFDTRSNSFMLNNVELFVEKPVSEDSPVGFRTDLHFGTDAEVTGAVTTGLGLGTDELDIQQGYVEYLAPVGNGLSLKAGKMSTLHGAEVVESKDNWNFSRSWMFGFAEPVTHTGVRGSYAWNDMVTTIVGVNNGWDVVDDNNQAKTVEAAVLLAPAEGVSLSGAYTLGAEQTGVNGNQRNFWSFVAGYDPIEALHLKLAFDYGTESNLVGASLDDDASWNGIAAYAKYDMNDWWSIAGRFEVFNDNDAIRTATTSVSDLQLYGITLTNELKLHEHLIARLEYRYDHADADVFGHDDAGLTDRQNTVAMEFIAPF